jgi:hypothetical protein
MISRIAAVLAFLTPACAAAAIPYAPETISQGVELTRRAATGGSVESTHAHGHALQNMLTGGSVVFAPSLHEVRRAEVTGDVTYFDDMQAAAEGARQESIDVPAAEVRESVEGLAALNGQKRVIVDGSLDEGTMGVFSYASGKIDQGIIALNDSLPYIGALVGPLFAYATAVHERQHASNHELERHGVVDGEVPAFQAQYAWLKFVDPTGEKLGLLRVALESQMRRQPNKLTQMALAYAKTLDVLVGTGGDERKIREFAHELGYRDDGHNHGRVSKSDPPSA